MQNCVIYSDSPNDIAMKHKFTDGGGNASLINK